MARAVDVGAVVGEGDGLITAGVSAATSGARVSPMAIGVAVFSGGGCGVMGAGFWHPNNAAANTIAMTAKAVGIDVMLSARSRTHRAAGSTTLADVGEFWAQSP